jgi:hypothetical protein
MNASNRDPNNILVAPFPKTSCRKLNGSGICSISLEFTKDYDLYRGGYWTEVFGTSNRLVYMLGYPSLGEREKSWAAFLPDPDWQKARAESEKNGTLVAKTYNRILRPTAYSPRG